MSTINNNTQTNTTQTTATTSSSFFGSVGASISVLLLLTALYNQINQDNSQQYINMVNAQLSSSQGSAKAAKEAAQEAANALFEQGLGQVFSSLVSLGGALAMSAQSAKVSELEGKISNAESYKSALGQNRSMNLEDGVEGTPLTPEQQERLEAFKNNRPEVDFGRAPTAEDREVLNRASDREQGQVRENIDDYIKDLKDQRKAAFEQASELKQKTKLYTDAFAGLVGGSFSADASRYKTLEGEEEQTKMLLSGSEQSAQAMVGKYQDQMNTTYQNRDSVYQTMAQIAQAATQVR